jgi:hypothetical protein
MPVLGDEAMSDGAIAQGTGCAWCGRGFTPRTGGGLPQRFCSTRHRRLFHSTARKFAERAISLGFLTADDLRRGPVHVFGRARSEPG